MYVLLVAATAMEIKPTVEYLTSRDYQIGDTQLAVLESGVGSMLTGYSLLSSIRQRRPDYLVQAGIAGSFSPAVRPGEFVMIEQEMLGDTGVQENGAFKDAFDLELIKPSASPFTGRALLNPHIADWLNWHIPVAKGITVNEITTSAARIGLLRQKFQADVESMEGAAFHYVCLSEKIPFIQFRSISNYVGERDKTKWKLHEAVQALNLNLIKMLDQFSKL